MSNIGVKYSSTLGFIRLFAEYVLKQEKARSKTRKGHSKTEKDVLKQKRKF